MSKSLQTVRGMRDIMPPESLSWQWLEQKLQQTANQFGYQPIYTPVLEYTELFCRSLGEVTDIVSKEMFCFTDRENGDEVTLRPEFTASCVRAAINNGTINRGQTQKYYYLGPAFRHERPQKGRYRQFHQFGIEVLGYADHFADLEVIQLSHQLWHALQIQDLVSLQINTLGTSACRARHREALVRYLQVHEASLDDISKTRLVKNPLRILDSKNPDLQDLIEKAPKLLDFLSSEAAARFSALCEGLNALGISYQINPRLVRGLDYYCHTVFEWVSGKLGAQSTVCAGGRYDGLVEQLGHEPTPAVGFALGIERLGLILESAGCLPNNNIIDCYIINPVMEARIPAMQLAWKIRSEFPNISVAVDIQGGNFKKQFSRADKHKAKLALIMGSDEIAQQTVTIKPLQQQSEQKTVALDEALPLIAQLCSGRI